MVTGAQGASGIARGTERPGGVSPNAQKCEKDNFCFSILGGAYFRDRPRDNKQG